MKEQILKLRQEGKTYKEITEILGCVKSTISYYCGKNQKQKMLNRKKIYLYDLCECSTRKLKTSLLCFDCDIKKRRAVILSKTIKEFEYGTTNSLKYATIRSYARLFLDQAGIKRECKICGFDVHVEACHIKPLKDFSKDALLSEVNSLDNLVYLCPNHHYMFDKGLTKL